MLENVVIYFTTITRINYVCEYRLCSLCLVIKCKMIISQYTTCSKFAYGRFDKLRQYNEHSRLNVRKQSYIKPQVVNCYRVNNMIIVQYYVSQVHRVQVNT